MQKSQPDSMSVSWCCGSSKKIGSQSTGALQGTGSPESPVVELDPVPDVEVELVPVSDAVVPEVVVPDTVVSVGPVLVSSEVELTETDPVDEVPVAVEVDSATVLAVGSAPLDVSEPPPLLVGVPCVAPPELDSVVSPAVVSVELDEGPHAGRDDTRHHRPRHVLLKGE
ncbi:hypothetical protein [Nannocystis pusilla]|uniref:hypothetical protein n=1 Tax=Nannocystis pusilla TaxID=889268 RepID=UPI003B8136F5